jgi:hypothetical protein
MWGEGAYVSDWIPEASNDEGDEAEVVPSPNYCTDAVIFFLDAGDSFDLPSSSDQGSEFMDENDDDKDDDNDNANEAIGNYVAPALIPLVPDVRRTSSFQHN